MSTLKVEEIQHISNSNNAVSIASDSSVALKHSGNSKLVTSSTGVTITGTCTADTLSGSLASSNLTGALPAIDGSALTGISSGVTSDAQFNTVGGTNAGSSFSGTGAEKNTLIGYDAGATITTGDKNTAYGFEALKTMTTGANSTMIGYQAGKEATGSWNTFIGERAGTACTTGNVNTIIGSEAGLNLTEAADSVLIGYEAGMAITTSSSNTIVGYYAGASVTGNSNTILGRFAGGYITTGYDNICIGNGSQASSASANNEITLGNSSITKFRIPGLDNFEIDDNGTIDLGGAINENVFALGNPWELDADDGTFNVTGNRTVTMSLTTGQSVLVLCDFIYGGSWTVTWPAGIKWVGGSAPTLSTTAGNPTAIEFFQVGSQLYGAAVGDLT